MSDDHAIARYRQWYRKLLRFYSRPHRERFGESMEQTFNDLCRERARAGERLGGFVLWTFAETSAGIIRENGRFVMMQNRIVRIAIIVGLILLLPLTGTMFVEGFNWDLFDFVVWGGILFAAGLTYDVVSRKGGSLAYRAAVGIACAAGFLLFWVNAAVGVIGDEDFANFLLVVVPFGIGAVGALVSRFQPRGMSWTLFGMAAAQAVIPVIALAWVPAADYSPGVGKVMFLNSFWVATWVASGLLFRYAGDPWSKILRDEPKSAVG
jgi:hypothetical protein